MTDPDQERSGELSSFLHLTGWRPVVLALVAGLAAAAGLWLALGQPVQWVARYVVNVTDVADDDMSPQQVSILADEMVVDMQLPQTVQTVEELTALVEEDDYEIVVRQSAASSSLIDVNVVAEDPAAAKQVAVETAIAGINETLGDQRAALAQTIASIETDLAEQERLEDELISQSNGLRPDTAYTRAQNLLLDRLDFLENRPLLDLPNPDGTVSLQPAPIPTGPSVEDLQDEVNRLEPIDREYRQVRTIIDDLNIRLAGRRDSVRELDASIRLIDDERELPNIIREVATEEASKISGLLTGILIFAVPAALATILLFVLFDLIFRRQEDPLVSAEPIDAHGVLDAQSQRALPVTTLKVVDEHGEEAEPEPADLDYDDDYDDEQSELYDGDEDFDDDDPDGPKSKSKKGKGKSKSKESRWGRDAGSKAG